MYGIPDDVVDRVAQSRDASWVANAAPALRRGAQWNVGLNPMFHAHRSAASVINDPRRGSHAIETQARDQRDRDHDDDDPDRAVAQRIEHVAVRERNDRARRAAQRARDAGDRAQRARDRRVNGESRPHQREPEQRDRAGAHVAAVDRRRRRRLHGSRAYDRGRVPRELVVPSRTGAPGRGLYTHAIRIATNPSAAGEPAGTRSARVACQRRCSLATRTPSITYSACTPTGMPLTLAPRRCANSQANRLRVSGGSESRRSMNAWIAATSAGVTALTSHPATGLERHRCARPRRPSRALGSRIALAHDERARGEISEPLVVARRDDRDRAGEVQGREEVDQAQHGADQARGEAHRPTTAAHDPEACGALADRASRAEHLEEHVVGEDRCEAEDDQHRADPATWKRDGHEDECDDDAELNEAVDEAGDEA